MTLGRVEIRSVRNLEQVDLGPFGSANVFFGANGSGKTTVLESIHLLGLARSFRSAQIKPVINHGSDELVVYGELRSSSGQKTSIGVGRARDGSFRARVNGQQVSTASELAENLAIQVINAESFELLTGGPINRRRYLDWGVFHVEHRYRALWKRFQRSIKQRNSLLRRGKISRAELESWDKEFVSAGTQIDEYRRAYLERLAPVFEGLLERLSSALVGVEMRYRRGWDAQCALEEALQRSAKADEEQGFTHVGPQRADLKLLVDGHDAGATLSRGQQKLVVCALKLAQGQLLSAEQAYPCAYLVDDLPSELDREHCAKVCELLRELPAQVFLTCVNKEDVSQFWANGLNMFHVEHGQIRQLTDA